MICKTLPYSVSLLALLTLLGACDPGSGQNRAGPEPAELDTVISALTPKPRESGQGDFAEASAAETAAEERRLVLERGNYWTAGIPGFGENALKAFAGEYRLPGSGNPVRIWLTREFLYYEGWTGRDSMDGVRQKTETEGIAAAAVLDNSWTVIVLLPGDLPAEEEDRLLAAFRARLTGISSSPQNVSLPALIPF
ncbi:MAG: hypothetical protein LBK74_10425 [Treponema sp.]|jgi:hypothetical protein|nr:hypothetical protein [Treponema sp.]